MKLHPLVLTVLVGTASVATTLMGCNHDSATTHDDEKDDDDEKDGEKDDDDGKDEADGKAKAAGMPDENPVVEIGSQLEQMTEIMKKHEDDPEKGVQALRVHLQDNLPNMMYALGTIIAEADKIDDPKERQKYLTLVTTQLALGFAQFGKVAEKYNEAIAGNEAASRLIRDWGENWAATAGTDLAGIEQLMSGF